MTSAKMSVLAKACVGVAVAMTVAAGGALTTATASAAPSPAPAVQVPVNNSNAPTQQQVDGLKKFINDLGVYAQAANVKSTDAGVVANNLLAAYRKLNPAEKQLADATNIQQITAKKYGPDSPEATLAGAGLLAVKVALLADGLAQKSSPAATLNSTDSQQRIADATFSSTRSDDPVWQPVGPNQPTADSGSYSITQNPPTPAK